MWFSRKISGSVRSPFAVLGQFLHFCSAAHMSTIEKDNLRGFALVQKKEWKKHVAGLIRIILGASIIKTEATRQQG